METNLFMLRRPSFSVILSVWEGSPMVSLPASVHGILRRFTPQDDRPVSQPSPPCPAHSPAVFWVICFSIFRPCPTRAVGDAGPYNEVIGKSE